MQDYTKLKVWQKSKDLSIHLYRVTRSFPKEEMYGLTSQMRRAGVSIPANIAEGCGRFTESELVRFLDIALGSVNELECLLIIALELEYLDSDRHRTLNSQLLEVKKMLIALIQKIRQALHRQ